MKYFARVTLEIEAVGEIEASEKILSLLEGYSPDIEDGPDVIEEEVPEEEDEEEQEKA